MEKRVFCVKEKRGVAVIRVTEKKLYQDVVTPFQNTMVSVLEVESREWKVGDPGLLSFHERAFPTNAA